MLVEVKDVTNGKPEDKVQEEAVAHLEVRPVPDPTVLTTLQLDRAITGLRNEMLTAVKNLQTVLEGRLEAQKDANKAMNDGNVASFTKMDELFTKQLDLLSGSLKTTTDALSGKVDDIRTRINLIEGRAAGYSSGFGYIATGIGIIGAIVGAIAAIFFKSGGTP